MLTISSQWLLKVAIPNIGSKWSPRNFWRATRSLQKSPYLVMFACKFEICSPLSNEKISVVKFFTFLKCKSVSCKWLITGKFKRISWGNKSKLAPYLEIFSVVLKQIRFSGLKYRSKWLKERDFFFSKSDCNRIWIDGIWKERLQTLFRPLKILQIKHLRRNNSRPKSAGARGLG